LRETPIQSKQEHQERASDETEIFHQGHWPPPLQAITRPISLATY
jgi:hypothetical protein